MKIEALTYSDIGARRENEDSVGLINENGVYFAIVADGLGGHGRGKDASEIVVDAVCKAIISADNFNEEVLENAISGANCEICSKQNNSFEMKTTVAALWIKDGGAIVSHAGDSRVYRLRGGKIDFHTEDHSSAYIAYKFGEIGFDELATHPDQNKLTRCLGHGQSVAIDTNILAVTGGDVFVVCSDGFWELLTSKELEDIVDASNDIKEIYDRFVRVVADSLRPQRDNCTFAVIAVKDDADTII